VVLSTTGLLAPISLALTDDAANRAILWIRPQAGGVESLEVNPEGTELMVYHDLSRFPGRGKSECGRVSPWRGQERGHALTRLHPHSHSLWSRGGAVRPEAFTYTTPVSSRKLDVPSHACQSRGCP